MGITEVVELCVCNEIRQCFVEGVMLCGWGRLEVAAKEDRCVGMFCC